MTDEEALGLGAAPAKTPEAKAASAPTQSDEDALGITPEMKAAAPQPRSWASRVGHIAGLTGEALGRSLEHVAGAPGDVEALARWGINKLGGNVSPENATLFGTPMAPTSSQIHQNSLVAGQLGNFTPENAAEDIYGKTVENLAPGVLGGLGLGMRLAPAIGSAVGSSLGGEAGKALSGGSPWGELAGSFIGGGVGAAKAFDWTKPNVENLLKNFGASENKQAAGEAAKGAFRDFLQQENALNEPAAKAAFLASGKDPNTYTLPEKEVSKWAALDAKFPNPHTDVGGDARPLYDILDSLQSGSGPFSAGLAKDQVGAARIQQIRDRLDNATQNGAYPLTWSDVRDARTMIGGMINNDTIENKPSDALKALYKGASKIIDNMANAAGAQSELAEANAATRELQAYKDQVLSKYIGKPGTKADLPGGTVANRILSGAKTDSRELGQIAQNSPEAANELMGGWLREDPRFWNKLTAQSRSTLVPDERLREDLTLATSPTTSRGAADEVRRLQLMGLGHAAGEGIDALWQSGQALAEGVQNAPGVYEALNHPTMAPLLTGAGWFWPIIQRMGANALKSPAFPRGAAVGGALGLTEPEWFHPER